MKSNKRWLQFIAAIWILVFHLWINVSDSVAELFFVRIGYVGVDIFFFVSAYSLTTREIKYKEFIINRFVDIYGKFLLFVVLAAIVKHWQIERIIKTLLLIDFFENGGGAFLWFVPAIMLFYLLFPFFLSWKFKYKALLVFIAWIAFSFICQYVFGYTKLFIFTNRLPVILAGYLLQRHKLSKHLAWPCLPIGMILIYYTGFRGKLQLPIRDMYFVCGIVLVIGIVWLCSLLKDNKAIKLVAGASLEIYAIQMIYGPKLVQTMYKQTKNKLLTNLAVMVAVIGLSIAINKLWIMIKGMYQNAKERRITR